MTWAMGSNIRPLEYSSLLNLATWANTNKMEVSVEKTVSQLFALSTKQHFFHLEYKGLPLKQVSLSKYLGVNLDSKLHRGTRIAETSEKGLKRLNVLKRLTATKWGVTQDVLTTVYKTYIHPVLDHDCEVVTLASTTNLGKYDVVQNSAPRIITSGAKSTPIAAMQLQTSIEPLDSHRDKFTLKFLESQKSRLQFYSTVATALPSKRFNLTNLTSNKADAIPEELKSCALETIKERYPANKWLHIYTDSSYLPETNGGSTGWF
ncbi:uncharacterized protein TNCV_4997191 [Trichonephila clavipes]|nr:uncharacterized protein TNCV_4997191 [Trichonephila clavipes]